LRERFDFSDVLEWTIEANPATVTLEYCRMLRAAGVDRLSFGAQSFDPRELKMLERHHDPDDVPRSVAIARAAGFTRLNLDLIFAIPGRIFRHGPIASSAPSVSTRRTFPPTG
jgi:oxygen-independent coproporphyrinogen-3 oxidase